MQKMMYLLVSQQALSILYHSPDDGHDDGHDDARNMLRHQ
jgi:hypothetical protein